MMFNNIKSLKKNRLYFSLRIMFGIVFVWASWNKILDPEGFVRIVQNYRILPLVLVKPVALILPWIEAVGGVFLITGYLIKGSAFIFDMLLIIFIAAFIVNLFRGIDVSCGCFSLTLKETKGLYRYLIRDLMLLGVGLWVFFYRTGKED